MNHQRKAMHALFVLASVGMTSTALADHSWGNYHWARRTDSFNLTVINSTTTDWDAYVSQAVGDWSASTKLNLVEDTGGDTSSQTRRQCKGGSGTLRICNLAYGYNGWLGIAGISIDANGHITTGYTKLNDSYFSTSYYNNAAWRQSVACQELGHNIGGTTRMRLSTTSPCFRAWITRTRPFSIPTPTITISSRQSTGTSTLTTPTPLVAAAVAEGGAPRLQARAATSPAVISVLFYDVQHALPILITSLFYLTPVFYPVSMIPEHVRPFFYLNPFVGILDLYHTVLYEGAWPSLGLLSLETAAATAFLIVGYAVFTRYKRVCIEIA